MIISLWNRDLELTDEQVERLQTWILDYLAKRTNERESLTHLVGEVRCYTRLKFPTRTTDAETMFEALGFTLVREKNASGCTLRTYVTV